MTDAGKFCQARQDVPGGDLRCFYREGHGGDHYDNDWGLKWALAEADDFVFYRENEVAQPRGFVEKAVEEATESSFVEQSVEEVPVSEAEAHAHSLAEGLSAVLASHGVLDPTVHWWVQHSLQEALPTVAKAKEYGTVELVEAGRLLGSQLTGYQGKPVNDQQALELQVYQYVVGKLGRWTAAVRRGEPVSDDTLFDLGVYARLVQKARETGEWP
ncbi:hypothetical protein SEA_SAPO_51 [Gordonia phage Sapo]|nr:hypothetical protein SEA_SAPO_51 [Gordonia phage Sapo]